ncbi:hypothetical protein [Ruminococcus callidus]|uniref:hypothetical protein n=1 Tax=Ruminococcus callidus TaxID=40519 RepID=UPI003520393B
MGHLFCCWLKFWRQVAKTITSGEQSSPILQIFYSLAAMGSEQEVFKNHGVRLAEKEKKRREFDAF